MLYERKQSFAFFGQYLTLGSIDKVEQDKLKGCFFILQGCGDNRKE